LRDKQWIPGYTRHLQAGQITQLGGSHEIPNRSNHCKNQRRPVIFLDYDLPRARPRHKGRKARTEPGTLRGQWTRLNPFKDVYVLTKQFRRIKQSAIPAQTIKAERDDIAGAPKTLAYEEPDGCQRYIIPACRNAGSQDDDCQEPNPAHILAISDQKTEYRGFFLVGSNKQRNQPEQNNSRNGKQA